MPRNLSKQPAFSRAVVAAAALLALGLSAAPAFSQSATPPTAGRKPAAAATVDPSVSAAASPAATDDQLRARIWAATARFVYADDPKLAKIRPQLEQTVQETSVKAFARSLDAAAKFEKQQLPGQTHVLKFLGIFKRVQADDPADAEALVQTIRAELEANKERMDDPVRSKSFAEFLNRLSQLAGAGEVAGASANGLALPAGTEPVPASGPTPDALTQAAIADMESEPGAPPAGSASGALTSPVPADAAPSSVLPMLSLILSALSLLGVIYLFLTRNRAMAASLPAAEPEPKSVPRKPGEPRFSQGQYEEMRKVVRAELAAAQAEAQPARQQQRAPAPANQPKAPARPAPAAQPAPAPPRAPAMQPQPPSIDELVSAAPAAAPAPPAPRHRTIYVNQQPLDGAFRRDNLADAPASYTIFEITVDDQQDPNHGTFVVTRNEGSHGGYIGSHHSILDPACVYSYPQGAVSRIITDAPGTVQKTPAGDWHILQKARIHFA